jgi:hypothetical protein
MIEGFGIRIRKAQKYMDPTDLDPDADPDPQYSQQELCGVCCTGRPPRASWTAFSTTRVFRLGQNPLSRLQLSPSLPRYGSIALLQLSHSLPRYSSLAAALTQPTQVR